MRCHKRHIIVPQRELRLTSRAGSDIMRAVISKKRRRSPAGWPCRYPLRPPCRRRKLGDEVLAFLGDFGDLPRQFLGSSQVVSLAGGVLGDVLPGGVTRPLPSLTHCRSPLGRAVSLPLARGSLRVPTLFSMLVSAIKCGDALIARSNTPAVAARCSGWWPVPAAERLNGIGHMFERVMRCARRTEAVVELTVGARCCSGSPAATRSKPIVTGPGSPPTIRTRPRPRITRNLAAGEASAYPEPSDRAAAAEPAQ